MKAIKKLITAISEIKNCSESLVREMMGTNVVIKNAICDEIDLVLSDSRETNGSYQYDETPESIIDWCKNTDIDEVIARFEVLKSQRKEMWSQSFVSRFFGTNQGIICHIETYPITCKKDLLARYIYVIEKMIGSNINLNRIDSFVDVENLKSQETAAEVLVNTLFNIEINRNSSGRIFTIAELIQCVIDDKTFDLFSMNAIRMMLAFKGIKVIPEEKSIIISNTNDELKTFFKSLGRLSYSAALKTYPGAKPTPAPVHFYKSGSSRGVIIPLPASFFNDPIDTDDDLPPEEEN